MPNRKQNCWEFLQCGRNPGGRMVSELGICPAAADNSFDRINNGTNGGRICWAVAGTFCGGKVQGSFAEKRNSCLECEFFNKVRAEEGTANIKTKFLSYVSRDGERPLFDHESYRLIKAGERFIKQGEVGDAAYIIQRGTCLVIVEKDGELFPVDHYGEGDIVGGMGILTGEAHLAHVEAETDLEVWVLSKGDFDNITEKDPELLNFLTEFVANRFNSRRRMAYRTIGKYVATDIIGRGGFSIVYKGVHSTLNMPVAIKMMRHNLAMNPEFLNTFHHEAKTIASLNHENILKIYDIEERFRTVFIIMELLEGENLIDFLGRVKTIPQPLAADIIYQTCHGLEYAHRRGIIHRDITTHNLFLLPGNRVKILDFGLACPIGTEDINFSGTAAYMAPEQIEGDAVDPRTDIYGLGIVAFEILTGAKPFSGETTQAILDMHLDKDIPDPSLLLPDLAPELREFITRAARRDPGDRFQDVSQALNALEPVAERFGLRSRPVPVQKQKMTNLFMLFKEEQQADLNRLIEDFASRAKEMGISLRISDFSDL